jgi:hypothetical protein
MASKDSFNETGSNIKFHYKKPVPPPNKIIIECPLWIWLIMLIIMCLSVMEAVLCLILCGIFGYK